MVMIYGIFLFPMQKKKKRWKFADDMAYFSKDSDHVEAPEKLPFGLNPF